MSEEEIGSENNGIWLCRKCHGLVDGDEEHYPPEILQRWKDEAQREMALRLSSQVPEERRNLTDAIQDALKAHSRRLQAMDDSFYLRSSASEGGTTQIELQALQPKSFTLRVTHADNDVPQKIREGRDVAVRGYFYGSKLLEYLSAPEAEINISTISRSITIALYRKSTCLIILQAHVSVGTEYVRVSTPVVDHLLKLELLVPMEPGNGQLEISSDTQRVFGKPISSVEEFGVLSDVIEALRSGELNLNVLKKGKLRKLGTLRSSDGGHVPVDINHLLNLSKITQHYQVANLIVPEQISWSDYLDAAVAANLARGWGTRWLDDRGKIITFSGDGSFFADAMAQDSLVEVFIPFDRGEQTVCIQDTTLELPRHGIKILRAKVVEANLVEGDTSHWRIKLAPSSKGRLEFLATPGINHGWEGAVITLEFPGAEAQISSP